MIKMIVNSIFISTCYEDVFFNSPMSYLPGLSDEWTLSKIRKSPIHILSGSGDYESPDSSRVFSALLDHKGIPHNLDIWGHDMKHDWPTWRDMLPYILDTKF